MSQVTSPFLVAMILLNLRIFPEKTGFTAWRAGKDIRQILQNNHDIPWPKTFQSFRSAEENNKMICRRKRVFRYLFNNFATADVTSALA